MRIALRIFCVVAALSAFQPARAADEKSLKNLQAPAPADVRPLPAGARPVRFARVVVQLRPEPWALVEIGPHYDRGGIVYPEKRLVSWENGQEEVKTSVVSAIFDEEMLKAGGRGASGAGSLFDQESEADLLIAVKVSGMAARLCKYCETFTPSATWRGAVTMSAHWEIYSSLERKVLATVETSGGFTAPKGGVEGDSDRLINEAFRDNARRLIASDDFRQIVTSPIAGAARAPTPASPANAVLSFAPAAQSTSIAGAGKAVAVVYASDGQGSGFLIGREGYLVTNRHVVGASKFVKVKWSDGTETLGEVLRSDLRRDVALVKVDPQGRGALAIRRGEVQQGETVFAIGTPLDDKLQNTLTKGIVSASRTEKGQAFIQSDVAITHGNSGGPLLDEKGQVIGIAESVIEPGGSQIGLNFFIPIDDALRVLGLTPVGESARQAAAH